MSSQDIKIEKIAGPFDLGEGPHWDDINQVLYFVDLTAKTIYAYDPATTKITKAIINNGLVGFIIPVDGKKNTFIAGSGTDLIEVIWDPEFDNLNPDIKVLATVEVGKSNIRFNDGKIDSCGRLWAGTMGHKGNTFPPNQGSLYRFGADYVPKTMATSLTISNGLAWSHDNKIFYFIDSPTYEVFAYDFDEKTGDISNKRTIFSLSDNDIPGIPDGMTIDKSGNLWIACYGGGMVIQINPKTGKLMRKIAVPSKETTSVAFGGKNRDILYVTSARQNVTEDNKHEQPMAGCLFAVHFLGE